MSPHKAFQGAFVPNWLMRRPEVSPGAKMTYGRLVQYAGTKGIAWPKRETIAKELAVCPNTYDKYIQELIDNKLVEATRTGLGMSNRYRFLKHEWIEYINADSHTVVNQDSRTVVNPIERESWEENQGNNKSAPAFVLPDWINKDIWKEFVVHRQRLRKPMSDFAKKLIVKELEKAREFSNPDEELTKAIRKGWLDVYPQKPRPVLPEAQPENEIVRPGPWAKKL